MCTTRVLINKEILYLNDIINHRMNCYAQNIALFEQQLITRAKFFCAIILQARFFLQICCAIWINCALIMIEQCKHIMVG